MLFKVTSDLKNAEGREFFELNPESQAIEEFNSRSTRQMFFVCLVADIGSPLRTLPEHTRRLKAAEIVGFPTEDGKRLDKNGRNAVNGKTAGIETAIAKYREIQYDPDRAALDAMDAQIQRAIRMLTEDKHELCRKEIVKTLKDGTIVKENFVDAEKAYKMEEIAIKVGSRIPELKEAKAKLEAMIPQAGGEILPDITTYTANDFDEEDINTEQSTIDTFMAKKRGQQ